MSYASEAAAQNRKDWDDGPIEHVWVFLPDGREDHGDQVAVFARKLDAERHAGKYIRRYNIPRKEHHDDWADDEKEIADPDTPDEVIYRKFNNAWWVSGDVVRRKVR